MAASRKRRQAKKARAETRTKTRIKTIAADTGPVTLAEAKALALAKQPKLAPRAIRKGAVPPASPANVGAEREKLENERRDELARRVREYKVTMEIMKKRGARRPRAKRAAEPKGRRAGGAFVPLQIFAEGDSWFEYPVPFFGGGIIPRLENRLGVPVLNLATAGDEVRYMLGSRAAQAPDGTSEQRLPGRRPLGRAPVLWWRQRHRRRPDGAMDQGLGSSGASGRTHPPTAFRHRSGIGACWIRRFDCAARRAEPKHALGLPCLRLCDSQWPRDLRSRPMAQADLRPAPISEWRRVRRS